MIMRRSTVCVRATNACIMHTEGDVINNLPHPLMIMNLFILHKSGLAGLVPPALNTPYVLLNHQGLLPTIDRYSNRLNFCGQQDYSSLYYPSSPIITQGFSISSVTATRYCRSMTITAVQPITIDTILPTLGLETGSRVPIQIILNHTAAQFN